MDREGLKRQLVADEGLRLKPYRDTVGKLTIGVGRNLDDVGISQVEAMALLDADIDRAVAACRRQPWWPSVADDPVRSAVMVNLMFNMGERTLSGFTNTLKAVQEKRWDSAAEGLRNSKWAGQVGARADRLIKKMREGV